MHEKTIACVIKHFCSVCVSVGTSKAYFTRGRNISSWPYSWPSGWKDCLLTGLKDKLNPTSEKSCIHNRVEITCKHDMNAWSLILMQYRYNSLYSWGLGCRRRYQQCLLSFSSGYCFCFYPSHETWSQSPHQASSPPSTSTLTKLHTQHHALKCVQWIACFLQQVYREGHTGAQIMMLMWSSICPSLTLRPHQCRLLKQRSFPSANKLSNLNANINRIKTNIQPFMSSN